MILPLFVHNRKMMKKYGKCIIMENFYTVQYTLARPRIVIISSPRLLVYFFGFTFGFFFHFFCGVHQQSTLKFTKNRKNIQKRVIYVLSFLVMVFKNAHITIPDQFHTLQKLERFRNSHVFLAPLFSFLRSLK